MVDDRPNPIIYRIGRMLLDGAANGYLVARLGCSAGEIETAWSHCQSALSQALADSENRDFRLMTLSELQTRMLPCLRLLLDWEHQAKHRLIVPPDAETGHDTETGSGTDDGAR